MASILTNLSRIITFLHDRIFHAKIFRNLSLTKNIHGPWLFDNLISSPKVWYHRSLAYTMDVELPDDVAESELEAHLCQADCDKRLEGHIAISVRLRALMAKLMKP